MRAALYLRVSTSDQDTERQERELREAAARAGHEIVEVYADNGISGAKGRDKRPAFDRLHKDATRRKFDIVMAWSVDRLGRSLQDLIAFLQHIHAVGAPMRSMPASTRSCPTNGFGSTPWRSPRDCRQCS
jgi:DNA invertase Pin-like site-specific DNA recombinase